MVKLWLEILTQVARLKTDCETLVRNADVKRDGETLVKDTDVERDCETLVRDIDDTGMRKLSVRQAMPQGLQVNLKFHRGGNLDIFLPW